MERPPSLLVVEDETLLRTLVAQFLRSQSYAVVEAADGQEGLDRFDDSGPFDLVLMDLNLPTIDGVEACRRIRLREPEQAILVCSATVLPEFRRALGAMGIDSFLTKPFRPDTLLCQVERAIAGMERGTLAGPGSGPAIALSA